MTIIGEAVRASAARGMGGDDPGELRALGTKCRKLARGASNRAVADSLAEIAADYEARAARVEAAISPAGRH
ncbi:MAG TPA: hypothetical protein VGB08_05995 [Allosphingosinicella sp.]